jgi:DNA-binding transcriptional LysR family regulator
MSDLDRFELFAYVAQAESLTQAAHLLGLTKASLSKQIKKLETDFRVDLFSRKNQRLRLTAQGKILLKQCLRLKKEVEDARAICQQFHAEPEGILHVVVFEYFVKQLIFPKLKAFLDLYPKLQLFIDASERIPDFEDEQVDLAVGFSLPAPPDIVRRKMMTTRYVLCASPQYFKENGKPETLEDLRKHFYIGHHARPEKNTLRLKSGYALSLIPNLLLNSAASMIECAKAGVGLVQLPLYVLEDLLNICELIEVLEPYQATGKNVYYYYPKYRYVQPRVRKFIDFFLAPSV